ncbi:Glycosyltransferase involved in cell wall bisynthesis [Pseudobutyrivibrio sp. UC1225]|uniref:glycosyltransferase family 2 protein n=1 Tax=Pseudobutyrivibrio sp. UC1225 TaxID=1798185 RepID=UPI0008EE2113|nr:glycosyltransferase family 2 protein [Pseudobutyrivibrio sp. UC1225]SFO24732.1 Glycosyltransferase involved in cell wall bisynthesis [Pseudobutyrivibrio sp. UC1225]
MSDSKKLVSIIVPAYNVEKYIEKCIESILAQTYREIEVLVVDDGSTDDTWAHIETLMKKDSRVKGLHKENSGVSATRNYALDHANGTYLQFVDADDYLKVDATETLVDALESSGATWVSCQHHCVDENGDFHGEYDFLKGVFDISSQRVRFEFIRDNILEYKIGYEVWSKIYISSIIREHNIRFNENCHMGEDLAFNICYGFYADSINCIEDRIYYYVTRSGSAMACITALNRIIDEHLALAKGIEDRFNTVFSGDIQDKFYQIFFKLILHGSQGHTAEETMKVVRTLEDDYYMKYLEEALTHKGEFSTFCRSDRARLYYRFGQYVNSYTKGDFVGKVNLKIYDIYRRLRKRETIVEWRLT